MLLFTSLMIRHERSADEKGNVSFRISVDAMISIALIIVATIVVTVAFWCVAADRTSSFFFFDVS